MTVNLYDDPKQRIFITVKELAKILGVSERTIYNQISRKAKNPFPIKPKRHGRLVKFDIRDVERYIDSL